MSSVTKTYADYEEKNVLGSGGFGQVVRCWHLPSRRQFAVKKTMLPPKLNLGEASRAAIVQNHKKRQAIIAQVLREAQLQQRGNACSHIVSVYGSWSDELHCYIVLEFCRRNMDQHDRMEETVVNAVAKGVGQALVHMHSLGVVHSDIKALNILKALDHSYKLADFGLAEDLEGRISANSRGGTFHYRAPEQLYTTGRRGLVFLASDVWSLGITIFRMLTGRHPFEGESDDELYTSMHAGLDFTSQELATISPQGVHFIRKLLEVDPLKRISALQLVKEPWLNLALKATKANKKRPRAAIKEPSNNKRHLVH